MGNKIPLAKIGFQRPSKSSNTWMLEAVDVPTLGGVHIHCININTVMYNKCTGNGAFVFVASMEKITIDASRPRWSGRVSGFY